MNLKKETKRIEDTEHNDRVYIEYPDGLREVYQDGEYVGFYQCDPEVENVPESVRARVLAAAKAAVCSDRNKQYGEPEDNFGVIADLWRYFVRMCCVTQEGDVVIGPREVAEMMIVFKVARAITSVDPSEDTYTDIAGYAACAAEIVAKMRKNESEG